MTTEKRVALDEGVDQTVKSGRVWVISVLVALVLWFAAVTVTTTMPGQIYVRSALLACFTIALSAMLVLFRRSMSRTSRADRIFLITGIFSAFLGGVSAIAILFGISWIGDGSTIPIIQFFLAVAAVLGTDSKDSPSKGENFDEASKSGSPV